MHPAGAAAGKRGSQALQGCSQNSPPDRGPNSATRKPGCRGSKGAQLLLGPARWFRGRQRCEGWRRKTRPGRTRSGVGSGQAGHRRPAPRLPLERTPGPLPPPGGRPLGTTVGGGHLQEDLLLGQERQVLEGKPRLWSAGRRPRRPPAAGRPRTRAPRGGARGTAPRAPGTRPATPWTSGCPSPPSPRRAQRSADSPRDAGNFLTSALGPRPRPVPAATAWGCGAGPAPP